MRRGLLLAGAALALSSSLALASPESLLPPSFGLPEPSPTPTPRATRSATPAQTRAPGAAAPTTSATATPVIQPLPSMVNGDAAAGSVALPENFPSLAELERMDPDEIDEVLGLKPKYDIPPTARREVRRVGIIDRGEGGFPAQSLAGQPAALVRAALQATRGPLVSRWGHILLRRALASRLDAPRGMDPVEFAAMRAALLNRIGEPAAARALVQDVDSANYDKALASAAFDAYLATGDILGMCPVARLQGTLRDDPEWQLTRSICTAYAGEARDADRELNRALGRGIAPRIDVLLAQRFAGAAADGRRAVNIEWDDVDELTPFRFSLARALGVEIPDSLRDEAGPAYDIPDVLIPAVPIQRRVAAAGPAAARGVLSSSALVDLYAQIWGMGDINGAERDRAVTLREAYVAADPAARLSAMQTLWGEGDGYAGEVLTAYAAARLPVSGDLAEDAPQIIASMLTAGLDRNAMRWSNAVDSGSAGWGLLALAVPGRQQASGGAIGNYIDGDGSSGQRKSGFLVAGLAGLGRISEADAAGYAKSLGFDLARTSPWSRKIDLAGELHNQALVSLLAGLGMQGSGWDKMTPRHLFHIVRALDRAGLNAEARMIAAEAVARA